MKGEAKVSKQEAEKRDRAEALGEKIKLLFMFVMDLKQDKDLLQEAAQAASDSASFAMSAAPLLGAMGMDYEHENLEASLRAKRAKAVINLMNVLDSTEQERADYAKKQQATAKARAQLRGILGH